MNYEKIYYDLIYRAKNRGSIEGYAENHHILPKSMGGTAEKYNMVKLTAREHFLCHAMLPKFVESKYRNQMIYAWNRMCSNSQGQERYLNSYLYTAARKAFSENHPCKGQEMRDQIRKSVLISLLEKNIGKFCTFTKCTECNNITYSNLKYCSDKCKRDNVLIRQEMRKALKWLRSDSLKDCMNKDCDKLTINKYCCSKKCFDIWIRSDEDNIYRQTLSNIKKESLSKLSKEEMTVRMRKSVGSCDQVAKGIKISKTKRKQNENKIV